MLFDTELLKKVDQTLGPLRLDTKDYNRVSELMEESMDRGLSAKCDEDMTNDLKMYITYVMSLPDGTEAGSFLALDLGGTNFRVLLIKLEDGEVLLRSEIFMVPEAIMLGTGSKLFDHIAQCMKTFLVSEGLENDELPLGFTFSFPCVQEGLASSRLVNWTKGYKCVDVEGENVVKLLEEAADRQNLKIKCVAVINDTVGTLMACAHTDQSCRVGLILGTGTNACYLEDIEKVEKWGIKSSSSKHVVINTEWGAFGNNGSLNFLTTEFDKAVDDLSRNPGEQIYEKMISGMYMGEIVRQVVVRLAEDGCLFKGNLSSRIRTPMSFLTKYISEIESDKEFELSKVRLVLAELDIEDYTIIDCLLLREICKTVSTRAAYLAAAGVVALLKRIEQDYITVAVDGSLYRYHPHFHDLMTEMIPKLLPHAQFQLMLSHDGSGVGAALVAAVSTKQLDVC